MTLLASRPATTTSVAADLAFVRCSWTPRSLSDLVQDQLAAMDTFHRDRNAAELAASATGVSREQKLDAHRRLDVVRRQHQALIAASQGTLD